jgi:hypothetical protein
LADLQTITLAAGGVLEFIVAMPGRRYADLVELLEPIHSQLCADAKEEVLSETAWKKLRLVVDEHVLTHACLMDGELLPVTNTLNLTPDEVVKRYQSLVNIERRFRVLK